MSGSNGFKNIFKDYFSFNRRERRGLIVLIVLIFISLSFQALHKYNSINNTNFPDINLIDFSTLQDTSADNLKVHRKWGQIQRFSFDPNTIDSSNWLKLGLSPKQVAVIRRYKSKGGRFFKPEDLKRIYVVDDDWYEHVKDCVKIVQDKKKNYSPYKPRHYRKKDSIRVKLPIELNSADSVSLLALSGVGPSFSRRIIKYRSLLGGYNNKYQLLEVYGMDSTRFHLFENQIYINDSLLRKIYINSCTFKELLRHPYVEYNEVILIMNYRSEYGSFSDESTFKIPKLCDTTRNRLLPYLSFE